MEASPKSRSSPAHQPHQPSIRAILKQAPIDGVRAVGTLEPDVGHPRQIVVGALLGTSILCMITLLGIPHLDDPLTFATRAFTVAIPLLAIDFTFATVKIKPSPYELFLNVLYFTSAFVAEPVGSIAALAGIVAVLLHLNNGALIALLASVGLFILCCVAVVGAVVLRVMALDGKAKAAGGSTTTDDLARKDAFILLFRPSLAQPEAAATDAHQGDQGGKDATTPPSP